MLADFVDRQAGTLIDSTIAAGVAGILIPLPHIVGIAIGELDILYEPEPGVMLKVRTDVEPAHGLTDNTLVLGTGLIVWGVVVGVLSCQLSSLPSGRDHGRHTRPAGLFLIN